MAATNIYEHVSLTVKGFANITNFKIKDDNSSVTESRLTLLKTPKRVQPSGPGPPGAGPGHLAAGRQGSPHCLPSVETRSFFFS